MKDIFDTIIEVVSEVNFKNKPIHVSYKYRVIYQVSRLVLFIGLTSNKSGCSILKIQVLSSALEDEELFNRIIFLLNTNSFGSIKGWKFSQLVSTAINYSNAEGITKFTKTGKIILTENGTNFFNEIMDNDEMLTYEKNMMNKLKRRLSDLKLMTMLEQGD